jgi:hypothetical protein
MNLTRLLVLFTLAFGALCAAQDQPSSMSAPPNNAAIVNPEPQSQIVRILTPVAGQMLTTNFVNLHFELTRPSASGQPNFLVQLDAADPVNMTSTDYTFIDLQPGVHIIRVTLVDANNSPQGSASTVQFKVQSAAPPAHTDAPRGAARSHANQTIAGAAPAAPLPPELRDGGDYYLPLAGSPLPLISLIGFGLLIGGAAQTLRR